MGYLARSMKNLLDKFWTLIELHEPYKENEGEDNKHSSFLSKPISHMANEVYVFTSPGLTSIVMFKEKASSIFAIASEDHNDNDYGDDDDVSMQCITNRIKKSKR